VAVQYNEVYYVLNIGTVCASHVQLYNCMSFFRMKQPALIISYGSNNEQQSLMPLCDDVMSCRV
jgi:hypothetical protein